MGMGKKKREIVFQIFLTIVFAILCLLILFPFLLMVGVSFSSEADLSQYGYRLIPVHVSLSAYGYVFANPKSVLNAYGVTFLFSILAMVASTFFMALLAYPLSKKAFIARRQISFYIYFTMLFSGGLVPTYILITQYLKLTDTIWVYIIPTLISPWYVFMMRTFFQELPPAIAESAKIDGASELTIFFRLIIPMSKPVIAAVALFMFLGKWNDWMTSMLYINKENLISLQYLLQRIMNEIEMLQQMSESGSGALVDLSKIPSETARMAMAVIVAGPALVVFPFFQKYFVKGLTVGSVKG